MKNKFDSMFQAKIPYLWPLDKGGFISTDRIVAVGRYQSSPIRRAVQKAKISNFVIDLTYGQTSQWAVFLDSGHIVICSDAVPVGIIDEPGFMDHLLNLHGEK